MRGVAPSYFQKSVHDSTAAEDVHGRSRPACLHKSLLRRCPGTAAALSACIPNLFGSRPAQPKLRYSNFAHQPNDHHVAVRNPCSTNTGLAIVPIPPTLRYQSQTPRQTETIETERIQEIQEIDSETSRKLWQRNS